MFDDDVTEASCIDYFVDDFVDPNDLSNLALENSYAIYNELLELLKGDSPDYVKYNVLLKSVLLTLGLGGRLGNFNDAHSVRLVKRYTALRDDKMIHSYVNKICMRVTRNSTTFTDLDIQLVFNLSKVYSHLFWG